MDNPKPILSIKELSVVIESRTEKRIILNELSIDVPNGGTVAIVGESGSGKTLAAMSILGLLPDVARISQGSVIFGGQDLTKLNDSKLRKIRGNDIGIIFQEPSTSLNPLLQVGKQIGEVLRVHKGLSRRLAKQQVLSLMELVGIPDPPRRYRSYPHQLSGGVKQRVGIAMALACRPRVLLADEPTTALDATIQAQILDLLSRLNRDLRMSMLLISHDLGVVAALADRVAVLHHGTIIEEGDVVEVLKRPKHPYTRILLQVQPSNSKKRYNSLMPLPLDSKQEAPTEEACPFSSTCKRAIGICFKKTPQMEQVDQHHRVRCFVIGDLDD